MTISSFFFYPRWLPLLHPHIALLLVIHFALLLFRVLATAKLVRKRNRNRTVVAGISRKFPGAHTGEQYNGNADNTKSCYSDRNVFKLYRVTIYYCWIISTRIFEHGSSTEFERWITRQPNKIVSCIPSPKVHISCKHLWPLQAMQNYCDSVQGNARTAHKRRVICKGLK